MQSSSEKRSRSRSPRGSCRDGTDSPAALISGLTATEKRSSSGVWSAYRGLAGKGGAETLYIGKFLTLEKEYPTASALAVKGGLVVGIGDSVEMVKDHWLGLKTEVIDFSSAGCVIPGFIESHAMLEKQPKSVMGDSKAARVILPVVEDSPESVDLDRVKALAFTLKEFSHQGITTVHDLSLGHNMEYAAAQKMYQDILGKSPLEVPIRVLAYTDWHAIALGHWQSGQSCGRLAFAGVNLSASDASEDAEVLTDRILHFHKIGVQVVVQANSSAAIDSAMNAFEEVLKKHSWTDHRHRIEHFQVASQPQLHRMASLGLVASFVMHKPDSSQEGNNEISVMTLAKQSGLRFCLQSPSTPPRPLESIWMAVTKQSVPNDEAKQQDPIDVIEAKQQEPIDVIEALRAYTIGNAWAGKQEMTSGTLALGKVADMVVLSADPLEVSRETIRDIQVEAVVVAGQLTRKHCFTSP
eukprot:gnl/MRDRNA2_/MRDRNA2_151668_c0_seq1.p1 gnl/MRDRNA2_/MRDRNA2_151668_c0~~gnl/MRDRNA2_/MRDRNA2_151668_c0_seq1.p1  ORF type:complete len:468 (+),score=86.98 gnl/MRDRNA2_/MRDRNA2_151668_c0_seq1:64-1467(+)